ncbi:ABC transporter substrate-binding protein [Microbispora hainanensis]|uniref:ABC transporter substrate-binding protein n=1 Tax=Microbispora hainanensis TaxID=568844 RepID=UPI0033DA042F
MRRTSPPLRRALAVTGVAALLAAGGCGDAAAGGGDAVVVNVGYQSKTINTVTAGTLLRARGTFEAKLAELGRAEGVTYRVEWHDFASGPPLTAEMLAGKIDIGSMGDYPVLVNGAKTAEHEDVRSELVAVTGYNPRGSLNQVVVPVGSPARTLADLRGKVVSTSVGSAAHGMLVAALRGAGLDPGELRVLNQEPPVGASAVEGGQADALAQFVPWPQSMIFSGKARLLYDGGQAELPTFHAVVARRSFGAERPEVLRAFLEAQRETTDYLNGDALAAAVRVAEATGVPAEVVYLYNGPNGLVRFDPVIKDELVKALEQDLPFLKDLGSVKELDLDAFVDHDPLRGVYGAGYEAARRDLSSPNPIRGEDPVCSGEVADPAKASEVWFDGRDRTGVARTPACLLKQIKSGGKVRAAYVPDAATGTRVFAHTATWVLDPEAAEDDRLLPFAIDADAGRYAGDHPGSRVLTYDAALAAVSTEGRATS